ncbi:hypothetical protein AMATHDRAFT_6899 [Amanita thiersii Skay4041]|uniref:Uncharacterized protein n=1 Tax=Amanita thiersii Skay4041 TaxID=703135 RepID=A0A2A9NHW0_9AGAR|nr:hypothetical protein AMATHDRAFT_6899 [Amanita thiersii Skay4041]
MAIGEHGVASRMSTAVSFTSSPPTRSASGTSRLHATAASASASRSPSPSRLGVLSRNSVDTSKAKESKKVRLKMEAEAWRDGHQRAKLIKEGYRSLALICTFMAGVQAQILSVIPDRDTTAVQVATAFFYSSLLANIFGGILGSLSARWFEMLTPEEADHIYAWIGLEIDSSLGVKQANVEMEEGSILNTPCGPGDGGKESPEVYGRYDEEDEDLLERIKHWWIALAVGAARFIAIIGFGFLAAGIMVLVWEVHPVLTKVLCTTIFATSTILLPPFYFKHDRKRVLNLIKLKRVSG